MKTFIRNYKKVCGKRLDEWLMEFSDMKDYKQVITLAATARNKAGRKHDHQRRISNEILAQFAEELQGLQSEIKECKDFDKLYELVEKHKINGIGQLAVYDTVLRICAFLKIYPDKIYLHNGTKKGAENLLGRRIQERTIQINQLPKVFQNSGLNEYHLENFLCIYKGHLGASPAFTLEEKNPCCGSSKPVVTKVC